MLNRWLLEIDKGHNSKIVFLQIITAPYLGEGIVLRWSWWCLL